MVIKELQISNFRSLKSIKTPSLAERVVFHGPNNSGKSNVLLALETIFCSKSVGPDVSLAEGVAETTPLQPVRTTPFWQGVIPNFADNFYMGTANEIDFSVRLEVPPTHFRKINDVGLLKDVHEEGHNYYRVHITGTISRSGNDGEIQLSTLDLNGNAVFRRQGENIEWFTSLGESIESTRRQRLVDSILNSFTDSVYVIPASRYLGSEKDSDSPTLTSSSYKTWLHHQSLSRSGFEVFKLVRTRLNDNLFKYGEISFVRDRHGVDIMVDDGCGYRMPIASKGTGVQQILVLLGYIAASKAHVIGIEEPELNLSFKSQDELITTLLGFLQAGTNPLSQILIASHSDHVGSRGEFQRIHVENPDGKGTTVRIFTKADQQALFPRSNKPKVKKKTK